MFGFIYITINKINGKRYLGQCRYAKKGWQRYLGSGKALLRAIKKYGRENFQREVILEATTREELTAAEIRLIEEYNAMIDPSWYNITKGGYATRGFIGKKHSPESNKKRAEKLRGRKRPPHIGIIVGNRQRGKKNPHLSKMARENKGAKSPVAKSVTINNIVYPTLEEAMQKTGISYYLIRKNYLTSSQ
jgi:group I intron endonuclease